jgi:tetratricopeptide (TPR) repeat protein
MDVDAAFAEATTAGGRCDLRYKGVDTAAARHICQKLAHDTGVTSLNLWKNSCGTDGAKAIADALGSNTVLRELDLEGNGIGDVGARALARGLHANSSLTRLNVAKNGLTDVGARALLLALQRNKALLDLDISKNTQVSLDMKQAVRAALKTNGHRSKAMDALKELASLAASDPVSLAAVRALAAGQGISQLDKRALDELAQDAGLPPSVQATVTALADAQSQAAAARARAGQMVEEASTATTAQTASAHGGKPSGAGRLGEEWVMQLDKATGKHYYWNTRTHTTSWKRPVDGAESAHSEEESEEEEEESEEEESEKQSESETDDEEEDSDDGLGASEDIMMKGGAAGSDAQSTNNDAMQRSLQQAVEAGSIAEMAIEHDSKGEIKDAIACYNKAGNLLLQAATGSQQSEHFTTKANEYLSRAKVLQTADELAAKEEKKPIRLSKKSVAKAVEQLTSNPLGASVDDVCGWLAALGLSSYIQSFREQLVDGPMLAELTDEQMRADLGVDKMGERGRIRRARDQVFGQTSANPNAIVAATQSNDQLALVAIDASTTKRQANKRGDGTGDRVKVQVRLGHDGEWINLKLPRSDMSVDTLRPRLASALQVHEHALGHLQYRDSNGEWFAALEDDDIFDGIADLGGRHLVLQAIGTNVVETSSGPVASESLKALVSPFETMGGKKGLAREKALAKAQRLARGDDTATLTSLGANGASSRPSALADARERRPERPEQVQTRLHRLLQDGKVEEAVETLLNWAPGRASMTEMPTAPFNALLKLANDRKMSSGISAALVQLMASRGIEADKAAYTHFLRALIRDNDLDFAVRVLGKMYDEAFPASSATYGGIMEAYVAKGEMMKAAQLGSKALAAVRLL